MGVPSRLTLPDQGSSSSSPAVSLYSPSETESSMVSGSSPSLPDSSSSSFAHIDSSRALTSTRPPQSQIRQVVANHLKKQDLCVGDKKDAPDSRKIQKCTCRKSSRGSKRALMGSCKKCSGFSLRKACCRSAGAFAADCAAVCCCPCAIFSVLAMVFIDVPSALAKRLITHMKKRRISANKDGAALCSSKHGSNAHSTLTPAMSDKDFCGVTKEAQAVQICRFDTETLLKHFDAEHVGFGCLSQNMEEIVG